jgi:hypothetical protein
MGTPAPEPEKDARAFTSAPRLYGGAEDYTAWGRATSALVGQGKHFCAEVQYLYGRDGLSLAC